MTADGHVHSMTCVTYSLLLAIALFSFTQLFLIYETHDHHVWPHGGGLGATGFLMDPELRHEAHKRRDHAAKVPHCNHRNRHNHRHCRPSRHTPHHALTPPHTF
jgi:hypothetical protein